MWWQSLCSTMCINFVWSAFTHSDRKVYEICKLCLFIYWLAKSWLLKILYSKCIYVVFFSKKNNIIEKLELSFNVIRDTIYQWRNVCIYLRYHILCIMFLIGIMLYGLLITSPYVCSISSIDLFWTNYYYYAK